MRRKVPRFCWPRLLLMAAALFVCSAGVVASERPDLKSAPEVERDVLARMAKDEAWPQRAIALLRLERYGCAESQAQATAFLKDQAWQVRAIAVASLARRGAPIPDGWLAEETSPRVLRAALRAGCRVDLDRLRRGVATLSRSNNLDDQLLAAEIALASGDPELKKTATTITRQVILRMGRAEAGALSARLAALTGAQHLYRPQQWHQWVMKTGRRFELREAQAPRHSGDADTSGFARLDHDQFVGIENYMTTLREHEVDLAICIDCTASMGRELAAAQGGIDNMMLFMADVVGSLRIGLVAYRDRKDEFETKGWDFNSHLPTLRNQLWQLSADGGGDEPEAVYPAMRMALTQLNWRPESQKVLIIVGDAPPHVGYGALCVELAKSARERAQLTTHAIQVKGKPVKHFPEIAEAGGGRCVSLSDADALIAEITGLTLGDRYEDEFREFFQLYLDLCQ